MTKNREIVMINGVAEWTTQEGDYYLVTGIDIKGKRLKQYCPNWYVCKGINLWRGTKWLVRYDKRHRIATVWN